MKTTDEIYQEMKALFCEKSGASLREGGDMALRLYTAAAQLYTLWAQADFLEKQAFPQTAAGEYLDRHAQSRGLTRTPAATAAGTLTFSRNEAVQTATQEDWATEFLDYILAVRVVEDLDEAIAHIAAYSSGHSECIVTENYRNACRFTQEVDAAAVYVNASTRFTDGGEFGLGAEIGISTQKLHARGPMGLRELTSYKYIVQGDGQIR